MPSASSADSDGIDVLREAFSRLFDVPQPRPFGTSKMQHQGVSDDSQGVQWNSGFDRHRRVTTLGVNLEGMKYGALNWPMATLIEREQCSPMFLEMVRQLEDAEHTEILLTRDAWQGAVRPPISEHFIGPAPPLPVTSLTPELWSGLLREAYGCLDADRGHRGRGMQFVTLPHRGRVERQVTPHLQVRRVIWGDVPLSLDTALKAMAEGRERLEAVHSFLSERVR